METRAFQEGFKDEIYRESREGVIGEGIIGEERIEEGEEHKKKIGRTEEERKEKKSRKGTGGVSNKRSYRQNTKASGILQRRE